MYKIDSPTCKGEVGVLFCVEPIQNLSDGLNRGMYNLCDTESLITSSSTSRVKSIGLPVIGFYLVITYTKENINVESLDIDHNSLKNPENLLDTA